MAKLFNSEELNTKIQEPFVFISYSQTDKTLKEVKTLYNYLERNEINVVYDNGGLDLGEQLQQFQQLIIHSNCYKVLIIFDETYVAKIENEESESGAKTEYKYISDTYYKNQSKFIPIKFRAAVKLPALFDGSSIYGSLYRKDKNEREKIRDACRLKKTRLSLTIANANKYVDDAERLYKDKDYKAAKKKIERIILSEIKSPADCDIDAIIAHAYSLILCMAEVPGFLDDTTKKSLQGLSYMLENNKIEAKNKPNYYLNCSKIHMLYDEDENGSMLAQCAYESAKQEKFPNIFYYECHLAYVFFKCEQYADAYKYIQSAYKHYKDASETVKQEHVLTWQKICTNYCEILVKEAQKENDQIKRKQYLNKAERVIEDLIELLKSDTETWSSSELKEIYEAMAMVYQEMAQYYAKMVKDI